MNAIFLFRTIFAVSSLCFVFIQVVTGETKPVPDRAAQQQAVERIKSVFADEYETNDRVEKSKFAGRLLDLAKNERDDVAKFTLYREAVRFASEAGDAVTAIKAIDAMASHFAISSSAVRMYAISNISKQSLPENQAVAAADACVGLVHELIADNEYGQAKRVVEYGLGCLRRSRDNQRKVAMRELGESVDEVADQFKSIAIHAKKLKEDPSDPTANLEVGKFECLVKGNWERGLSLLTKGSDASLKQLAEKTLAHPDDAQEQFQVANGWWNQGEKLEGVMRDRALAYAGTHYKSALPKLAGLSKATAEKRIEEAPSLAGNGLAAAPRQRTINLLELIDPAQDLHPKDKWAIANGALHCTRGFAVPKVVFPYHPPEEYDVTIVFAKPKVSNGVGIIMPNTNLKSCFTFLVGGEGGKTLNLMAEGDKYKRTFPRQVIHPNVQYKVVFSVRKEGVKATINDTPVVDMKTDFMDLKAGTWHRIREWESIGICCDEQTVFYAVQVTEVTGEGGITRFPKSE